MLIQGDQGTVNNSVLPGGAAPAITPAMPAVLAIGQKEINKAIETLTEYKKGKESLENRVVENEKWYKLRHWEVMRAKYSQGDNAKKGRPEPTSAWLFNAIANKHADAMDNYPDPNILPRVQDDEEDAKSLTTIIPIILERNEFEETYSNTWWYKLKMGVGVYGTFWDKIIENGLGDISVKKLDLLKCFWEPGITDIQKSRNFFIVDPVDNDIIEAEHPELKGKLRGKTFDVKTYVFDDAVDTTNKSLVIDWYYKKRVGTKTVLHYVKFVEKYLLYSSENDQSLKGKGWYEHGQYPVDFDVLFPEEGTPIGFGFIDIAKDPQMYIDKLKQIIIENALKAGKKRYFVKDNGGVNEDDFADWSKDFVRVAGSLSEDHIKEIVVSQLSGEIYNFLNYNIDELKETVGNRDVNQGSSSGGVTAAAAIAALQEAGNKISRDIIKSSYRTFTKVNYKCIELIRQFYDISRTFRIEGKGGAYEYIKYSNSKIRPQVMQAAAQGVAPGTRVPIFDIKVKPQRSNPFNRMAQNELAKELYGAGFFDPNKADQALIALDMMDFEGKEAIIDKINRNKTLLAMVQQLLMMINPQGVGMEGAGAGAGNGTAQPGGIGSPSTNKQSSGGMDGAAENATTSYGEKLAARAQVTAK